MERRWWRDGGARKIRPPGLVSGLDGHREAVDRAIRSAGLDWTDWPELTLTEPLTPGIRLSALLLLLSTDTPREMRAGSRHAMDDPGSPVIERLRHRRLPWDAATACTALRAVLGLRRFDGQRVGVALRGAEQVCSSGQTDAALMTALVDLRSWLEHQPLHIWHVPEARTHVRRVLAMATPPDVLDLSLLHDGDAWAGPAREAARSARADDIAAMVRQLGELGPRRPSLAWRQAVADAAAPRAARDLLHRWLRLAADTDVVPPDEHAVLGFSGGMLFAHGNDDLVRAAVLATEELREEPWVPEVLGILARRGAAVSGVPGMPLALALKVAGAAVDTLAARGTRADREVLEQLLEDLTRRDLVRRVGAHLGREDEADRREEQLRRTKAAAVRRKADPAPRQARAALDVLVRRHLAPALRQHGFTGSGRTLRRLQTDRVDAVAIRSGGPRFRVTYGTRFDASHPADEPYPVERKKIADSDLDIRHIEDVGVSEVDLNLFAVRLSSVIIPFLDGLGRYELVLSYVEHGTGSPPGSKQLEGHLCPATSGFLGLLALEAGDRHKAIEFLTGRLDFEQALSVASGDRDRTSLNFWRGHHKGAQRLG
jgi:hypothetical protein